MHSTSKTGVWHTEHIMVLGCTGFLPHISCSSITEPAVGEEWLIGCCLCLYGRRPLSFQLWVVLPHIFTQMPACQPQRLSLSISRQAACTIPVSVFPWPISAHPTNSSIWHHSITLSSSGAYGGERFTMASRRSVSSEPAD